MKAFCKEVANRKPLQRQEQYMDKAQSVKGKGHHSIRVPARASAWYVISGIVARGIGFFGTPIFTRLLSPEEYGLFPLYTTWFSVISVFATLELTGGVIHRGLQKFKQNRDKLISSAFWLIALSFSVFCILYFTFSDKINGITGLSTSVTVFLLIQIILNSLVNLYTSKERFDYNYKTVALINLSVAVLNPIISVLLIELANIRAEARIIGGIISLTLVAIPILFRLFKRGSIIPSPTLMKFILRTGEIAVGRIFGQAALGKYSVAMSVGMSLTMITNGISSALGPWILRKLGAKQNIEMAELIFTITKGLALLCLFLLSVAPELFAIATPESYRDALNAAYPLVLTVIPMFLSGTVMTAELYYEKSGYSSVSGIIAAIISISLSFLLLPYLSYAFAGVFALVSYLILTMLNTLSFKRLSGYYPIFPVKTLFLFLFTSVYALGLFLLKDVLLSRIILTLPLILPALKVGLAIFKKIKE